MQDKILYSKEAEASILGSMMMNEQTINDIAMSLQLEDFYFTEHKAICKTIFELHFAKKPVDAVSVRTALKETNRDEKVGKDETEVVDYLRRVLDSIVSTTNARYYCQIVKGKSRERKFQQAVIEIQNIAGRYDDLNTRIQDIQKTIFDLPGDNSNSEYVHIKDISTKYAGDLRGYKRTGFETGFRDIDRKIQGLAPGELYILAGRPSMGKSALALDIVLNQKPETPILFSTLEMPERTLTERAVCSLSRFSRSNIINEDLSEQQWQEYYQTAIEMRNRNIIISTIPETPERLFALVKKIKNLHGLDIVVVDYLQLMHSGRKKENRQQEISEISRKLKRIAQTEQVAMLVLSQLNRKPENREGHKPRLSDLRDSGSIEQDADVAMLLHREDYFRRVEPDYEPDGEASLNIAKNRNGPTGNVNLVFIEDLMKFENKFEEKNTE